MSKKVVNLGKVKGRTLDLKVDNKILKKKYDDEIEWQELGKVGGIDTVDTVNDLPVDAEQDDIAFVKEAAFVETVEYQEEMPIVLQGGEQILDIELRQEPLYLSEINFEETFPEFSEFQGENGYMTELGISGINGETSIMAISYPASFMVSFLGVEQPVDMYQIMHYGYDDSMLQYHKLRGMSIKDYMTSLIEIPATEEQMQILFGEHYNDKTEDNPSYEWIKVTVTEEPINESSVFLDDANAYITLEFDAIVDLKGLSMFEGYGFSSMKMGEEGPEGNFSIEGNLYDIEEHEKEEQDIILKFGNVLINTLYSGGLQDISYDVYTQKGFHKFDEGWKSLEEDMNIPKVVDTYSDLPKSFIENGLMAVANEEKITPEPINEISMGVTGSFEIKGQPSVQEEVEKIKQFFIAQGASSDLNWEQMMVILMGQMGNPSDGTSIVFAVTPEEDDNGAYCIFLEVQKESYYSTRYFYFDEAGARIDLPQPREGGQTDTYTIDEGGCWYYYEVYDNGKRDYLNSSVQKMKKDDWFSFSNNEYLVYVLYGGYSDGENGDEFQLQSCETNFMRVYDSSKTQIYPQGFYKYSKNRWHHQPDIAGASFDNEDILKQITGEDIGNIELNTEVRHSHNNKSVLDQLPWDSYDKLVNQVPANTNARHTHSNQYYLDQITGSDYVHKHNNKTILDKITSDDNVHTHSNKSALDNITSTTVNNITANTNARHSHSNKTYLDKITYDITTTINTNANARHTHSNKGVLDAITNSTILDISNNKSARHSHTNKTILDKVTQTHLDSTHTHGNKEVLDSIKQDLLDKSHNHANLDVLGKLSIDGDLLAIDNRIVPSSIIKKELVRDYNNFYLFDFQPQSYYYYYYPNVFSADDIIKINLYDAFYSDTLKDGSDFWIEVKNSVGIRYIKLNFYTPSSSKVYWTNGVPSNIEARLWLNIRRMNLDFFVTWYTCGAEQEAGEESVTLGARGLDYNYNYGKITDDGFVFAPACLSTTQGWYVGGTNEYLEEGYQRVYGNTEPLNPIPPNTYEEFKVHNLNDLIIIERNYIPYEICSGYYVNSSYIKNFTNYFYNYSQEELNIGMQHGIDLSNAEYVWSMFYGCQAKTIPTLDVRAAKKMRNMFAQCTATTIEKLIIGYMDSKTFKQLGLDYNEYLKNITIDGRIKVNSDFMFYHDRLSSQSYEKFFEILEDNTGETQYTINVGTNVLSQLSPEQIAIVTNKNILLA